MRRKLQLAGEACGWGLDRGAPLLQGVHHVLLAWSGIIEAYEVNVMMCLASQSQIRQNLPHNAAELVAMTRACRTYHNLQQ